MGRMSAALSAATISSVVSASILPSEKAPRTEIDRLDLLSGRQVSHAACGHGGAQKSRAPRDQLVELLLRIRAASLTALETAVAIAAALFPSQAPP